MIQIYDIPTARQTILKRQPLNSMSFPPAVLASTERLFGSGVTPAGAVAQIIASIQAEGDAALRRWCTLLDKVAPQEFRIPAAAMEKAYKSLPKDLQAALQEAARRIRLFHQLQPLPNWETESLGGRLGQRVTPIERVGVYVPGGTAPLPSSLLMSVIPAQVAGVQADRRLHPAQPTPGHPGSRVFCAASIGIYQVGGAQAIAAMAFGTESIPRVDKIVGAGNLFVTLAKQQVYGIVGLDGLAGPTETVVIADGSANPAWVAADLLAQAEHDVLATAILLTPDRRLAEAVQVEVARQMESLSRAEIIAQSLASRSGIVLTPDLETRCQPGKRVCPRASLPVGGRPGSPGAPDSQCRRAVSWAKTPSRCWAITSPAPATSCPPAAQPALLRRSTCWILSRSPASSPWIEATSRQLSPLAAHIARAETADRPRRCRRFSHRRRTMFDARTSHPPAHPEDAGLRAHPAVRGALPAARAAQPSRSSSWTPTRTLTARCPACTAGPGSHALSPTSTPIPKAGRCALPWRRIMACRRRTCWLGLAQTS